MMSDFHTRQRLSVELELLAKWKKSAQHHRYKFTLCICAITKVMSVSSCFPIDITDTLQKNDQYEQNHVEVLNTTFAIKKL